MANSKEVLKEKISNYEIPITTDLLKWGSTITHNSQTNTYIIDKFSSPLKYVVSVTDTANHVKLMLNKSTLLQFIDEKGANDLSFTRKIGEKTLLIYSWSNLLRIIEISDSLLTLNRIDLINQN